MTVVLRQFRNARNLTTENTIVYYITSVAGWSSLVARRAHNPKVRGSNPLPATNDNNFIQIRGCQIVILTAFII